MCRIRLLEEEAARLRADYRRQQGYVAVRTFPATTYPTPPPSITPPDSPPRHHHRHTATTFRDFYNSELLHKSVITGSQMYPGGLQPQPAAYREEGYKNLHGRWGVG